MNQQFDRSNFVKPRWLVCLFAISVLLWGSGAVMAETREWFQRWMGHYVGSWYKQSLQVEFDVREWRHRRLTDMFDETEIYTEGRFGLFEYKSRADQIWQPVEKENLPSRAVLLVHGLDEPGGIWDHAAASLEDSGHDVLQLRYPNDQPIGRSAAFLVDELRALHQAGVVQVDLVTHSMGGLVARDAMSAEQGYASETVGQPDMPDIKRLVMVAPPNHGSGLARFRGALEWREQVSDLWAGQWHPLDTIANGSGAAGLELIPGSAYLAELNDRPLPHPVKITIIAGLCLPSRALGWRVPETMRNSVGDGAVTLGSTRLNGVTDHHVVPAQHRTILTGGMSCRPAALPFVVDRLAR